MIENYRFEFDLDPTKIMIPGWREFAEQALLAVNAISAARNGPQVGAFVCGGDDGALPSRTSWLSEAMSDALDGIMDNTYFKLMVLPDPFAHLVAWMCHLTQRTFNDRSHSTAAKALCHSSILMLMDQMVARYIADTGFTANAK